MQYPPLPEYQIYLPSFFRLFPTHSHPLKTPIKKKVFVCGPLLGSNKDLIIEHHWHFEKRKKKREKKQHLAEGQSIGLDSEETFVPLSLHFPLVSHCVVFVAPKIGDQHNCLMWKLTFILSR